MKVLPYLGTKSQGCYLHQEVYIQKINGIVTKKFIDKENHNYQTIYLSSIVNKNQLIIVTPEFGDMYDYLNIGDSIIKEPNSIFYRVHSKNKDTIFKFYTICKDSLKHLKR